MNESRKPMTVAEVEDLLKSTLHGLPPQTTIYRIMATLAEWMKLPAELEKAQNKLWRCPMCKRDRRLREGDCCNPKCGGMWGTGCYCCHHQSYVSDAIELYRREIGQLKEDLEDADSENPQDEWQEGYDKGYKAGLAAEDHGAED